MTPQLKILIVEDEAIIAEDLQHILLNMHYTVVAIAYSFDEAVRLLENQKVDLMLTDIALGGERDGIELVKLAQEEYNTTSIIITSHSDKATVERASAIRPAGYIVKPFQPEDVYVAIELAKVLYINKTDTQSAEEVTKDFMFIKEANQLVKVNFAALNWLKAEGNYVELHTNSKRIVVRSSLKELAEKLPACQFVKVHKSYIVNLSKITHINAADIKIDNCSIPLGRVYREQVLELIGSK